MNVPTASGHCSRNRASAMARRMARDTMVCVDREGRGNGAVIVVVSVILSVGFCAREFYSEGLDGNSRLQGAGRDGQSDGGPPGVERSDGQRVQPHERKGGVA